MSNSQLDLGLDLDYDRETQEQPDIEQRSKIYKLKLAKRYKLSVFPLFILQLTKVLIFFHIYIYIYSNFILKLHNQNTRQLKNIHSETTG